MASFPMPYGPVSACSPTLRKRGTRKSRLETKPENDASSALPVRLWCHLPLQNPANRAENLIRLCSATICQTGWRMVQSGAIRSTLENPETRDSRLFRQFHQSALVWRPSRGGPAGEPDVGVAEEAERTVGAARVRGGERRTHGVRGGPTDDASAVIVTSRVRHVRTVVLPGSVAIDRPRRQRADDGAAASVGLFF